MAASAGSQPLAPATAAPTLRRSVTPWGSFSWGYSDVGADIFVGLGLVLGAAAGASNIAFLFAGVVYVCVGLAYTELAAAYPVAGGGQYFVMRGLGDIFGFIAGWAVLLDFTIDITLFAWSCIDYLSKLLPILAFTIHPWTHFWTVFFLIVGLATLNFIGVRESSAFNEIVSGLDIASETAILFFGFVFAFRPELLVHTMQTSWPTPFNLMNGVSLAIISFVGLESISQAAQETQRPASVIPRTSISLILTILIFALSYSNLALGMQPSHAIPLDAHGHAQPLWAFLGNEDNNGASVQVLASLVPYYGALAALYVPVLGAILLLISSNSGVFGSSRIAYAMSQANLLPSLFRKVHPKFRTPAVSIAIFCGFAVIELIFAALPSLSPGVKNVYAHLFKGEDGITFLGDLYAFGAAAKLLVRLPRADRAATERSGQPAQVQDALQRAVHLQRRARRVSAGRRGRLLGHILDPLLHHAHPRDRPHRRPLLDHPGHHRVSRLPEIQRLSHLPLAPARLAQPADQNFAGCGRVGADGRVSGQRKGAGRAAR